MSETSKKIVWIVALIILLVLIGVVVVGYVQKATNKTENPIVTMEVENYGTVKIELYPDQAPETVANFITLANRGFYNGLTFHRIVKDFMIQGGDPKGNGTGSAKISNLRDLKDGEEDREYTIKGEFIANKVNNKVNMEEGTLAMARSDYSQYSPSLKEASYNSGCSQFFIVTANNETTNALNGLYTPFGKVIEGMDVVHNIEATEVKAPEGSEENSGAEVSTPVNPPKITSIKVDTKGVDYGMPKTLQPFDYQNWLYKTYGINPNSTQTTIGE